MRYTVRVIIIIIVLFCVIGCVEIMEISPKKREILTRIMQENGYSNVVIRPSIKKSFEYDAEMAADPGFLFSGYLSCDYPITRCSISDETKSRLVRLQAIKKEL